MNYYRIEIMNVDQTKIQHKRFTDCTNMLMVPVFLIPGIESPFDKLGLRHDLGNSR